MKQNEKSQLQKMFPTDKFTVKEKKNGGLDINARKATVRIFKYQADNIKGEASDLIEKAIANLRLTKKDFEQSQVTVTKELKDRLDQETAKCKTRRIVYLQRLLNGQ